MSQVLTEDARQAVIHALQTEAGGLEPGLEWCGQDLALPHGSNIPLLGRDAGGRPCLVQVVEAVDSGAWDALLDACAAFRLGQWGSDPTFLHGREPRAFLLARTWSPADRARLGLLQDGLDLRGLLWAADSGTDGRWKCRWNPLPESAAATPAGAEWTVAAKAFLGRLTRLLEESLAWHCWHRRSWPRVFGPADRARLTIEPTEKGLRVHWVGAQALVHRIEVERDEDEDRLLDCLLRLNSVPL